MLLFMKRRAEPPEFSMPPPTLSAALYIIWLRAIASVPKLSMAPPLCLALLPSSMHSSRDDESVLTVGEPAAVTSNQRAPPYEALLDLNVQFVASS